LWKKKHEKKCPLVVARQQLIFRVLGVVEGSTLFTSIYTHAFVTKYWKFGARKS
jgi:hypothetical protein